MGYQLHKVIDDMMRAMQREGSVQVGVNLDMSSVVASMQEQAEAFHCDPEHINTFLSARSLEQELFVLWAHRKAYEAVKRVSPETKVGLTLSLFDYQPIEEGMETAEKLWYEDFGYYLPYFRDDDSRRCRFIREAFESVQECRRNGVPVVGYCYWSLLDNFEWQAGFG